MSKINVNTVEPEGATTTLTLGASGDTVDIPSGATLDVTGATVTGLSAGKVLQVVQGTYATQTSTTSSTPVTSNLAASITPSSSSNKVLVMATVNSFYTTSSPAGGYLYIYRDSTQIVDKAGWNYSQSGGIIDTIGLNYLDSPSSTSSVTYTIYFSRQTGGTTNTHDSGNPSFIILMEIEA